MNTHGSFGIFNPFLYSIGSAGSELAFEVILSDNCTKRTAIAKQVPQPSCPLSLFH